MRYVHNARLCTLATYSRFTPTNQTPPTSFSFPTVADVHIHQVTIIIDRACNVALNRAGFAARNSLHPKHVLSYLHGCTASS